MNNDTRKKKNTVIFITLATIGNVVLMIILFILGFVLLGRFGNPDDENGNIVWMMLIFFASIGLSWFIYSRFVKWYTKRVNTDEAFAPLFSKRRNSSNDAPNGPKMNMKE